jgi:WD40 repeat protein
MIPYYERTIRSMAENKLEKHIAKALLVWVVTSTRSLTVSELSEALKVDINIVLPSAKSAIEGLCGQLVSVNSETGVVDLVHPTAREFLLSEAAGEFRVMRPVAHERIALACLQLLSGASMHPPRSPRWLKQTRPRPEPSPLLGYVLTQFTEHLYGASSETDELLAATDRFLKTTVLSWIEKVCQKGDLHCLIRASKNFKAYLDRRAKYHSPLSSQVRNVGSWSVDLSRLVTRFGTALLQNPSSIYFLIPPLCPTASAIHQQFGKRVDGLTVVGSTNKAWDDCVASLTFGEDSIAATVSCGESQIAIGMESGDINLYNHRSCLKMASLHQKYPVDLVHLTKSFILACTTRSVILQDLEGNMIWEQRVRFRCILLTTTNDTVIAISQHGHKLVWDITNGNLLDDQRFIYQSPESGSGSAEISHKAPSLASISPDLEMLALGYRGGAVCLWELASGDLIGWALDEENKLASVLLFNPNPSISFLLVVYSNHDLALFETWSGSLVHSHKMPSNAGILSASCSPDGRSLATVDMQGNLQIWDFESLTLLYHVLSMPASFRILSFTSDGSGVVDVMDSSMRIWSPATLIRKNIEEDYSVSDDAIQLPAVEGQYESLRISRITAICTHPLHAIVFAGKFNGQLVAFNAKTGDQISVVYSHPESASITRLTTSRTGIIASSDADGNLLVWNLGLGPVTASNRGSLVLRWHSPTQISQLCFCARGTYLLVSTTRSDHVFSMTDGTCVGSLDWKAHQRHSWYWLQPSRQLEDEHFLLLCDREIQGYGARDFPRIVSKTRPVLQYDLGEDAIEVGIQSAVISKETHTLIIDILHNSGYVPSSTTFMFDLSRIDNTAIATLPPLSTPVEKFCKYTVGFTEKNSTFVFLGNDSWIYSISLVNLSLNKAVQHFFVPSEYLSWNHRVLPVSTFDGSIVFCLHGELAIVRNGLGFEPITLRGRAACKQPRRPI